jgi:phage-related protein
MNEWTVTIWGDAVAELAAMPNDIKARLRRIADMIEHNGFAKIKEPYVKHIEGKLWEIRASGRDGIARSLYFTATGRQVIVIRIFTKKTDKTPRSEINLALKRMKDWQDEQED